MEQNESQVYQYMVEFEVPPLTEELIQLIPDQRHEIDRLFVEGKLLSYAVSEDRSRVWAVMMTTDEDDLLDCISSLPMSIYMEYYYEELMFHNSVHLVPSMSLN